MARENDSSSQPPDRPTAQSPLLACVPNFSEGRDPDVIRQITDRISSVGGIKLLGVESGRATNRTVVTFVGAPTPVLEAAVRGAEAARDLIDMSRHRGEHPRFGALDVCPLVPIAGLTMDQAAEYARRLGERIGTDLGIPVYLYEFAARDQRRRNLADVRAGEYEGLADKLTRPEWRPDFGPPTFLPRTGATAVGARRFLVAYNVNLNTTSTRRANAIAFDVREKGRVQRAGGPLNGEIVRDERGEPLWVPGSLPGVKAIGWYIEEYGLAQVSMNLTDLDRTPLHVAFDEVCRRAEARGVRVTGSEIVGVVPLEVMLEAGRHFLRKQQRSTGVPDRELVRIAIRSLGLNELGPFDPEAKIIEYAVADPAARTLVGKTLEGFVHATAADTPAPGGGSVSAAVGALGAALGTMVANLSSHKRGWDDRWEAFSRWAERGTRCHETLLSLVDEDTRAFNAVLAAYKLPKDTAAERAARQRAVSDATRGAVEVPLRVMEAAVDALEVVAAMAEQGLPSSVSDAGVGALCAAAAVRGAGLNVRINLKDFDDRAFADQAIRRAEELERTAGERETKALAAVRESLSNVQ